MAFQNVTIAGTGVLGSQIAYQTALNGFNVTAYDRNPDTAKKRVSALKTSYQNDLGLSDDETLVLVGLALLLTLPKRLKMLII